MQIYSKKVVGPSGVHGRQGRCEMHQAGGEGEAGEGGRWLTPSHPSQKTARQQDKEVGESTLCCGKQIQAEEKPSSQAKRELQGGAWDLDWGCPLTQASLGAAWAGASLRGPTLTPCQAPGSRRADTLASCEPPSHWTRCFLRNVVPVPVPGFLYGAEIIHQIFGMCN